jgi:2-polyprenyl-3-methyl-5-hydroxy-6-metoxy-1,4-benzoquinol methylase
VGAVASAAAPAARCCTGFAIRPAPRRANGRSRNAANCGLVWLYPPATAADLARAYESYYTHVAPTDARALGGWRAAVLRTEFGYDTARPPANGGGWQPGARLLRRFGLIRDSAGAEVMYLRAHPDGRLLDVGCGSGSYLSLMRGLGWQVTGVEPDAAAVSRADPEIRPFLHVGTLEQAGFDAHSFDAITLHHVIEHVPDPVATLRECGRLLAHGGRLVALTPNSEALGRWFFRRRWLHWDPPRHLHVFTRRSLAEAARLAGLRQPTVRTTARGARWAWRASRSPIRDLGPAVRAKRGRHRVPVPGTCAAPVRGRRGTRTGSRRRLVRWHAGGHRTGSRELRRSARLAKAATQSDESDYGILRSASAVRPCR